MAVFRNLEGTIEESFQIGNDRVNPAPILTRVTSTARLRLPDLLRWLPSGVATVGLPLSNASGDLVILSGTQGNILYHNGTTYVNLPPGTSGQILQTAGGAGNPSWTDRIPKSGTNPISPANGDFYYNTTINKLMAYDSVRGKWLSVTEQNLQVGRATNTGSGSYYRGADGLLLGPTRGWPALHDGTVVAFSYTRSDSDSATFDIVSGGVSIATVASTATSGVVTNLNGNFSAGGILAVRNAGPNTSTRVQATFTIRWRT